MQDTKPTKCARCGRPTPAPTAPGIAPPPAPLYSQCLVPRGLDCNIATEGYKAGFEDGYLSRAKAEPTDPTKK